MKQLLVGENVFYGSSFHPLAVVIDRGRIVSFERPDKALSRSCFDRVFSFDSEYIVPGFADVHVHLREPGFSYKETIRSGTAAAACGGYSALCAMPNVDPPPDSAENLKVQLALIRQEAACRVVPFGAITRGRRGAGGLSDMAAMAPFVAGFSDDGCGVQAPELMKQAMQEAKRLGKLLSAHCEDNSLLRPGGCVHNGAFARAHGLPGISSESEWRMVERDLKLAAETGCRYHVCHVSTRESVALVRQAIAAGLPVTAETAPHYLTLCEDDLRDDGDYKMNPPLRTAADREALLEGLCDGTIGMIATDHAPHSPAEKAGGLRNSLFGITGLETAFPVLYTALVKRGVCSLETLITRMAVTPRQIFSLPGGLEVGQSADFTVLDLQAQSRIDRTRFRSAGRATPFDGMPVTGAIKMTMYQGEPIWTEK